MTESNIVESLRPLAVPIESVRPLRRNPRRGNVEVVRRSLERFGQRRPITVRQETGEVTAGNHLLAAAVELGWDTIAAVFVDDDESTAMAWSLADNRSHDVGDYDDLVLDEILDELAADAPDLLDATGYDVETVLARLGVGPLDVGAGALLPPSVDPKEGGHPFGGRPAPAAAVDPEGPMDAYDQFGAKASEPVVDPGSVLDPETVVLFRFGDLRARVTKKAYDELYDQALRESDLDVTAAGVAVALRLGLGAAAVEPARRADRMVGTGGVKAVD